MVSNPVVHSMTARPNSTGTGHPSKLPRTATHAPIGPSPSATPSHTWHNAVKRLAYGYPSTMSSTIGDRTRQSRLSIPAPTTNAALATTISASTNARLTRPAGKARSRVRGFEASMRASTSRFCDIAAVRAITAQKTTQ